MPATNIKSQWVNGDLYFRDKNGLDLFVLKSGSEVRINSHAYTTAASVVGLQIKPRMGVDTTDDVIGIEAMPGINNTFDGKGIKCFKAEPYWGSTAGTLSEDAIGLECTLGHPSGAGTVTGTVSVIKAINNCAGTITGGVYPLHVVTHGDSVPWTGLALLPDDDQIAGADNGTTLADISATVNAGWIKVQIGTPASHTVKYIPLYDVKAS